MVGDHLGVWMGVILVLFSGIVGKVVMSTLAAVLIVAALGSFRSGAVRAILRTGRIASRGHCHLRGDPVPARRRSVGVGLVISLLMQLNQEALDLRIVQLKPLPDGRFAERPAPRSLTSREVLLLDVYGSLFYAGARTLQAHLPDPGNAEHPAVVLRLRDGLCSGRRHCAAVRDD